MPHSLKHLSSRSTAAPSTPPASKPATCATTEHPSAVAFVEQQASDNKNQLTLMVHLSSNPVCCINRVRSAPEEEMAFSAEPMRVPFPAGEVPDPLLRGRPDKSLQAFRRRGMEWSCLNALSEYDVLSQRMRGDRSELDAGRARAFDGCALFFALGFAGAGRWGERHAELDGIAGAGEVVGGGDPVGRCSWGLELWWRSIGGVGHGGCVGGQEKGREVDALYSQYLSSDPKRPNGLVRARHPHSSRHPQYWFRRS